MSTMSEFKMTKRRVMTRRGVLWLGQTCNMHCQFCYFLKRVETREHPEHPFMSIQKARQICSTLVDHYHNNAIDIQGGEPTIYKDIFELVRYCREIGLLPTLITNALVLSRKDLCLKLKDAGVRDLLVSVHGLGDNFNEIVGVPGAHKKQMQALEHLQETEIPFRFNCVLSKMALKDLKGIAELAIRTKARVVNFIAFNPFEDQLHYGKKTTKNVPGYTEVVSYLTEALDILGDAGIESNLRYFPICLVEKRHRKSVYNFQQLTYDIHEWDYASWSWTGLTPQRMRDGDVSPLVSLEETTFRPVRYAGPLKYVKKAADRLVKYYPKLKRPAKMFHRGISGIIHPNRASGGSVNGKEGLYRENARMRAVSHCHYIYSRDCALCAARNICDGFHGDYAAFFGLGEARPIVNEPKIDDPRHYIAEQEKVVENEDYEWAG